MNIGEVGRADKGAVSIAGDEIGQTAFEEVVSGLADGGAEVALDAALVELEKAAHFFESVGGVEILADEGISFGVGNDGGEALGDEGGELGEGLVEGLVEIELNERIAGIVDGQELTGFEQIDEVAVGEDFLAEADFEWDVFGFDSSLEVEETVFEVGSPVVLVGVGVAVGGGDDNFSSAGSSELRHLDGVLDIKGAVIDAGDNMAVNIEHGELLLLINNYTLYIINKNRNKVNIYLNKYIIFLIFRPRF